MRPPCRTRQAGPWMRPLPSTDKFGRDRGQLRPKQQGAFGSRSQHRITPDKRPVITRTNGRAGSRLPMTRGFSQGRRIISADNRARQGRAAARPRPDPRRRAPATCRGPDEQRTHAPSVPPSPDYMPTHPGPSTITFGRRMTLYAVQRRILPRWTRASCQESSTTSAPSYYDQERPGVAAYAPLSSPFSSRARLERVQ